MKKNNIIIIISCIILIALIAILIINNTKETYTLKQVTFTEAKELIKNKEDFVIILSQSTCSHCALYKPKAKLVAEENNINIYYLDYDTDKTDKEEIIKYFNFDGSTPQTFFFKEGEEISLMERITGDVEKEVLVNKLKKLEYIQNE